MANVKNIQGQQFGRLIAVLPTDQRSNGKIVWQCACDCGRQAFIASSRLLYGSATSCGCVRRMGTRTTHGRARSNAKSPEYKIWMGMRRRCNNRNDAAYKDYGGRGISVCQRWDSFEAFELDMGPRPSDRHSIDRVDNNAGYSRENCRWATWGEQQRNRRSNRVLTAHGITASLAELCERFGVSPSTAQMRLKHGASPDLAITPGRLPRGTLNVTIERLFA